MSFAPYANLGLAFLATVVVFPMAALAEQEAVHERIETGMSTSQVLDLLGPPDAAQPAIRGFGKTSASIWEYALDDSSATENQGAAQRLTIVFQDGEVHAIDAESDSPAAGNNPKDEQSSR